MSQPDQKKANPMQGIHFNEIAVGLSLEWTKDEVKVDLKLAITDTKVTTVTNTPEYSTFVYLEDKKQPESRNASYSNLMSHIANENNKYYIITDSPDAAAGLLNYINGPKNDYTNKLANNKNLLFTTCHKYIKCPCLPTNYQIFINKDYPEKIASFQRNSLIDMRPTLKAAAKLEKLNERYSTQAILRKEQSGKIYVFTAELDKNIVATLVLNEHSIKTTTPLNNVIYISDLLLDQKHIKNYDFAVQFVSSVLQKFTALIPQDRANKTVFTLMAPGDPNDPLIKIINHLESIQFFNKLDRTEQIKNCLVCFFVDGKDPKISPTNSPAIDFTI